MTPPGMTLPVLALGAWLKNTACLARWGAQPSVTWSDAHGDLSDPDACRALEASAQALLAQAGPGGVAAIAHDLHPDFFSTQLAVRLAQQLGVPAVGVQHHHAHVAAVAAEWDFKDPADTAHPQAWLGLALDGVGLGTDGTAWGGELLAVHSAATGAPAGTPPGWQRLGHLQTLALPGGDKAAREPWRMLAASLHISEHPALLEQALEAKFPSKLSHTQVATVAQMLARGLNCPPTTSAGRWFDAAAAALGLCGWQHDEAEAAQALERAASAALADEALPTEQATPPDRPALPPLPTAARWTDSATPSSADADTEAPPRVLELAPLVQALCAVDATDTAAVQRAAAAFHRALADALVAGVLHAREHWRGPGPAPRRVALSGGCFFNRLLRERVQHGLHTAGLVTALPTHRGCGDAGLALGQAWVAWQHRVHSPHQELLSCV